MRKIHCHVLSFLPPVRTYFAHWRLCYKSLTHNTFDSTTESMFEPLFYSVDFAIRWFGVAFVTAVICLVTSVVTLFYMNVMPYIITTHSAPYAYIHLLYGHYLLVMIMFNYYKAVRTEPGVPPSASSNMPVTSICKKCICPKPPRAHHCSVCKRCRLKMDHHCPWLNGCVGHYNHRYFICFCTFMLLGTFYVSLSSWPIFCDCFRFYDKAVYAKDSIYSMLGYNTTNQALFRTPQNAGLCANRDRFFNSGTVFLWILCSAVTVALGCLTFWHFYLISCGETSVEQLINSRERKRLKKLGRKFVNPYHLGLLQNWKYLLGFSSYKSFFRKVLLPSTHLPPGNGIVWETNNQKPAVLT